jgi:type I restriction enzyme S subunit
MAVWSAVSVSQLEYSRIDADFYQPMYLKELQSWRRLHERLGVSKLRQLIAAPVRTGRTPKSRRIKGDEQCVIFIKTDTVRKGSIDFENSSLLPARVIVERDYIPDDALVITIIGATPEIVGRTAIVRSVDPACVTNQNVAIVSVGEMCDPYYLTAYFQTNWGRDQIWRHSRRTEQVNLNCREVERVLVPTPSGSVQEKIGNLVRDSFAANDHSLEFYGEAQQLFESELRLDELISQKPAGYAARFSSVDLSNTFLAGRADAQCFAPDALFYEKWLQTHSDCDRLGTLLRDTAKGRQQVESSAGSTDYCSIKHISGKELITESKCSVSSDTPLAGPDDLLLAITGATIGKIGIVKRYKRLAFSGDLLCLQTSSQIDPNYLLMALDHQSGQGQVSRWITGSTNGHLAPRDVARVLVPRLPDSKEEEIAQLVRDSLLQRRRSGDLLDQAKSHVEQLFAEAVQS